MINIFKIKTIYFLLAAFSLFFMGCSGSKRLGSAQKAYDIGEYHKATKLFDKIYKKEKNKYYKGEISFLLGESYRHLNQPRRSTTMYGRANRFEYPNSELILFYADELRKVEKYEEAIEFYDLYMEKFFGDQRAYNGKASCKLALNPPPHTKHKIERLKKINSRYSSFSPFIDPEDPSQIYFTTLAPFKKSRRFESQITGQGLATLRTSIHNARGDWQDPEFLTDEEPSTEWEDGTLSITGDGKDAYFTRTRYDENGPMGAEIWRMSKMAGRWGEASKVELGPDSLIFAHPAISPDGKTLYFVSDMSEGFGGKDIWKVVETNGEWSMPINLGSQINTAGDEMFPYVRDNGMLYFSSNGHVGYGGLDIYKAKEVDDNDWDVKNMGQPINSISDDFGITFHKNRNAGFFSSSRDNARGTDNIFSFEEPVIQIVLYGMIKTPDDIIPENTKAHLIGNEGTNMVIEVQPSGEVMTLLKPENDYILQISSPGFFNQSRKISTKGIDNNKEIELRFNLEKHEQ